MGLKKKSFSEDEIAIFDEAIIEKRGDFWHFRMWLTGEGKYVRISLRTRNRQAAIEKAKQFFFDIKSSQNQGKKYFSRTAQEGVEMYLEQRKKDVDAGLIVKGRHGTIRSHLQHWVEFIGAKTKLKELERTDCENYYHFRSQESGKGGASLSTIKNEQSTINAMMEWLFKRNEVTIREFEFKKLPRIYADEEAIRRATFSRDEVAELRKVLFGAATEAARNIKDKGNLRRFITSYFLMVASITGLRTGEQRQLTWGDIRFETVTKGDDEVEVVAITVRPETSKVRKRRQFYVQDDELFDNMLKVLKPLMGKQQLSDCLVFSKDGKSMVKEADILETFNWAMTQSTIKNRNNRNLVPYSFRHYFITDRIKSGLSYEKVAKMCGTSVAQIEKTYFHIDKEVLISNALAGYFVSEEGVIVTT
jgi:site-specific recombinase XerD